MITRQERILLIATASWFVTNLAAITTTSLLYGASIVLFTIAARTVLEREVKRRSTRVMVSATVFSFLMNTLYWAAYTAFIPIRTRRMLSTNASGHLDSASQDINGKMFMFDQIMHWSTQAVVLISDVIVIWRAWVVLAGRRWLIMGPLVSLLGAFVTSLAFLSITSNVDDAVAYSVGEKVTGGLIFASGALSLATNGLSTLLIGYQLWNYRKFWNLGSHSRWSQGQKVLLMFVESGALYVTLQLATLATVKQKTGTPQANFGAVIWAVYVHSTAMYPTIVLLLIENKRSFEEIECFVSPSLDKALQMQGSDASPTDRVTTPTFLSKLFSNAFSRKSKQ